jgi:hypothetical protein
VRARWPAQHARRRDSAGTTPVASPSGAMARARPGHAPARGSMGRHHGRRRERRGAAARPPRHVSGSGVLAIEELLVLGRALERAR